MAPRSAVSNGPRSDPRRLLFGVGLVLVIGLLAWKIQPSLFPATPDQPISAVPAPAVGHPAPDFTLPTLDGPEVRLADLRGKPIILNFWATWCPPCRKEMPALEIIWQQHNRGDVVVLGVDQGESVGTVSEYVRQNVGVTFPLPLDRSQAVGDLYLVRSLPTTFFIDAQGIIREIRVGGPMESDFLTQQVRKLIR